MNLYLTGVPERTAPTTKIGGIKLLREHFGLPLVDAKRVYDTVEAGKAALLAENVALPFVSATRALEAYGFTLEFADEPPELETPGPQPPSLEAQRAVSILLSMAEGSVVKVAVAVKLLAKTHDEEFWNDVFQALTDSFNMSVES